MKINIETSFKALTFNNNYVDINMLDKGIYTSNIPVIYGKNETIDTIINRGKSIIDMMGNCFNSDFYFENLSKCTLSSISINLITNDQL